MFIWQSGSTLGSLSALLRQVERLMGADGPVVSAVGRKRDTERRPRPNLLEPVIKHDK